MPRLKREDWQARADVYQSLLARLEKDSRGWSTAMIKQSVIPRKELKRLRDEALANLERPKPINLMEAKRRIGVNTFDRQMDGNRRTPGRFGKFE